MAAFNNDAMLMAAAQMLQASGPSRQPQGLGAILGGGMATYMGAAEQARQRKMEEDMQAERMALVQAQTQAAQQKMKLQTQALESFGGIGGGSAASGGGSFGGGSGEKPTLDQLRRLAIAGVPGAKELFDIHKYENEPQKLEAGSTYVNRRDGTKTYMPKLDNGFALDGNGNAVVVPGYADGQGSIEGTKTAAIEKAKADYETTTLDLPGGPRAVSKADLPRLMSGGGSEWDGVNSRYKANQPQRVSNQIAILQEELAKTTNPKDRAQIEREIRMAGGAAGGPGIALANPLDKERQLNESRAATEVKKAGDLATQTSQMSAAKLNKQLMAVIPAAEALLKAGPTGSGIGALADQALGFFGRSTDSGKYADQLETLGGWLTSNVPRMEGPQSNIDMQNYRIMAGNIADRTKPVESRMASLKSLQELVGRYAENSGIPNAPAAPATDAPRKVATMSDIAETARKSGRSTAEVTAALRAKGYTIGGK